MRSRAPLRASELGHNAGACAPYRMAYFAMAFVPVKLLLKARLRIRSPLKGTHGNFEFPAAKCADCNCRGGAQPFDDPKAALDHEQLFLGRTTLSVFREPLTVVGQGELSVCFPSLGSSVFFQYLRGFFNRQCLDGVSMSGHCRCSKQGVVCRLLGGFDDRHKQWRHGGIRQHLDALHERLILYRVFRSSEKSHSGQRESGRGESLLGQSRLPGS
jgi:hypothetical protein